MPTFRRCLPPAAALTLVLAMAACSGHSGTTVPTNPPGVTCSIGTQVQLANPLPNASGVPTNIGQIQIVVNAGNDILGSSWNMILVDQFGSKIQGGTLTLTTDRGGPHPFPTDYYYNASVSQLTPGDVYNVYLNQFTSQCTPLFVNSFAT